MGHESTATFGMMAVMAIAFTIACDNTTVTTRSESGASSIPNSGDDQLGKFREFDAERPLLLNSANSGVRNPHNRFDVTNDGQVSSADYLAIVNVLNGAARIGEFFYDVSGDGLLSPIDGAMVLNELNRIAADCSRTVVNVSKSLLIRDPAVLSDPRWSFIQLMSQLKPDHLTMKQFIDMWLDGSAEVTSLNGVTQTHGMGLPAIDRWRRNAMKYLWPKIGRGGPLDYQSSNFRLLAIVNRMDLAHGTGDRQSAGEGRFVYGLFDFKGRFSNHYLVLEYDLRIDAQRTRKWWASQWHDLAKWEGSIYRDKLEGLTKEFTLRRRDQFGTMVSALKRARHSFVGASYSGYTFQRFLQYSLDSDGFLKWSNLDNVPHEQFHTNGDDLIQWAQKNRSEVLSGRAVMPSRFTDVFSSTELGTNAFVLDPLARGGRKLSRIDSALQNALNRNTCAGCHSLSDADQGAHIKPGSISPFLQRELVQRSERLKDACIGF